MSEGIGEIYTTQILEWAGGITQTTPLEAADATAEAVSLLCGARVAVSVCVQAGVITQFSQEVTACVLSQAVCALVARDLIGCKTSAASCLQVLMQRVLKGSETLEELKRAFHESFPDGRFSDLIVFTQLRFYRARHPSLLLIFEALEKALNLCCPCKHS